MQSTRIIVESTLFLRLYAFRMYVYIDAYAAINQSYLTCLHATYVVNLPPGAVAYTCCHSMRCTPPTSIRGRGGGREGKGRDEGRTVIDVAMVCRGCSSPSPADPTLNSIDITESIMRYYTAYSAHHLTSRVV